VHADALDGRLSHEWSPPTFLWDGLPWQSAGDQTWERTPKESSANRPSCSPLQPACAGQVWNAAQRPPCGHRCARRPAGYRGRARIAARLRAVQAPRRVQFIHEFLVNQGLGFNRCGTFASPGTALGPCGISRRMGDHSWDTVPAARAFELQRMGHASSRGCFRRWIDRVTKGAACPSVRGRSAAGAPESHVWSPERTPVMNAVRRPLRSRRPPTEDR
jgi:hypothetical protein